MSESVAICTDCDHVWIPTKPPEEIDQPRCSACDATGGSILFEAEADVADAVQRSARAPDPVRDAKRERRWREVQQRLIELLDRLEGTAPSEIDKPAAREVYGPFVAANKLRKQLGGKEPGHTLEELNGVSDHLDELEEEIDDAAPELDILDDLQSAIEELEAERGRLQTRNSELKNEADHLARQVRELKDEAERWSGRLASIEDERELYRQTVEDFRVTIPCSRCGQPVDIIPDSERHNYAKRILQGHFTCQECPPPWRAPVG